MSNNQLDRQKHSVTKIEAAQRQLDCAIELWFHEKDQVSTLTLAASAYQIIQDICAAKGTTRDLLYDSDLIKDEYRRDFINLIKAPYNFFKHADKDPNPDSVVEFVPFGILAFMMFSMIGLGELGYRATANMKILNAWLLIYKPEWWTDKFRTHAEAIGFRDGLSAAEGISRPKFYEVASRYL
jgi:hypothetical protein